MAVDLYCMSESPYLDDYDTSGRILKSTESAVEAFLLQRPARPCLYQTTTNMSSNTNGMLQPQIFESLQQKIDEDTSIRDVSNAPPI